MKWFASLLAVVLVGATVKGLPAQQKNNEALLEELFSTGTHAYYAGQFRQAYELLSEAIAGGLQDPRVFYMRGVVLHALGRPEQGERDFRKGAELEVRQQLEPQDVNGFLTRVQGRLRVKLEQIRRQERVKVLRRIQAEQRARYQALQRRQSEVSVPEKPGVDPLADQSELPEELASKLTRPEVKVVEVDTPPPASAPNVPKSEPKPSAPVAQAGNEKPPAASGAPKPKPGTLKATTKALGKVLGGLFSPPAKLPGGLPLPGGGNPSGAAPPQNPAPQNDKDPFDF